MLILHFLAPNEGIEPPTYSLTASRSTAELIRNNLVVTERIERPLLLYEWITNTRPVDCSTKNEIDVLAC